MTGSGIGNRRCGGSGAGARPSGRARGAVLLEVILALALFAATSGVVLGSLNVCLGAARRIRLGAVAADLAVTRLSEIQMGLVPLRDAGPEACEEPHGDWTWQVATTVFTDRSAEGGLKRVEIVLKRASPEYVYRLVALVAEEQQAAAGYGGVP